ncbi:MAG TPA: hypothetical protein VGI39_43965 [Polyangiaceae bacterium]
MAPRVRRSLARLSLLGASSLLVFACSARSTTSGTAATAALDSTNGGLNPSSKEAPAFGDSTVEALPVMDATLAQQAEPTDPTASVAATPGATAYRIALVWGHLPAPHDATTADPDPQLEDWDGSISVAAGAISLKRTIAFDANDSISARTDPTTLGFKSHTLPYVDGVLLRVVIPAGATPGLNFSTDALKTTIDLSALAKGIGGVQRLADDVEGLAWVGFPEDGCARGFVHGRWVKEVPELGRLVGAVSDSDGQMLGHVRGLWGHAPKRDADVWFAKYIDTDGDAKGLAFGKYGDGTFDGVWGAKDENDTVDLGTTEGFYSDGYEKGDGRGVWLGRWSAACPK